MKANLHFLSPILWTKDLKATTSFYENTLGFSGQSDFPNFVSLARDKIQIMFVSYGREAEDQKPKLTGSIYIFTEKVDEFWEFVKDKAKVKSSIADREYLMRDFAILDNNGYELVFGEDISLKKGNHINS